MGRTPYRKEASSSGTEITSHVRSPEWISGAYVNFKTPNSAMKQTRNRRTSLYQGRKSPQKQDIDSKQTPNGRFKVPVPFVISPPGVKTRARRSSMYQKAGTKNMVNLSLSPTHAKTKRRTSAVPETKKSPRSTTRRMSVIVPGKNTKKNSPVAYTSRSSRSSVYMKKGGTEKTVLTSLIEKADINKKVLSSNSPSDTVILKPPAGKPSPGSLIKKRKPNSVFRLPSPDYSPTAERARSDSASPSASPANRQSPGNTSKNQAASNSPKRKRNISEQTSPKELIFEVTTPDTIVGDSALSNNSANKVSGTPMTNQKSSSHSKESCSPLKSPTTVRSLTADGTSPFIMIDKNSSAKKRKMSYVRSPSPMKSKTPARKRRLSPIKSPSPKKLKTPIKHQPGLRSPSLNKVKTPVGQQNILNPNQTPGETTSSKIPTSKSPTSRRKSNYSTDMSTLAFEAINSSFIKGKRLSPLLKKENDLTPSSNKKVKLTRPAVSCSPTAELVKSAGKIAQEQMTSPPMQYRQQTPSAKAQNLSTPLEKTVNEVTVELRNRRNSCYSTPMSTSAVVGKNISAVKRKRSASPSKQDKQQAQSVSKRSKLSSASPIASSVNSIEKSQQDVEISHSEQKSPSIINNKKRSLLQTNTPPKKQKANKLAKVKSKRPTFGKKMKTVAAISIEKTRTPTPGRPRGRPPKVAATDMTTGFIRKRKLIDGDNTGEIEVISIAKSELSETDGKLHSTQHEDDSILNTTISTDSRSNRCIIL